MCVCVCVFAFLTSSSLSPQVTVFYHETRCRLTQCRLPDGSIVPFDSIPITELRSDSLATNPSYGGNNFDNALTFMEPYLKKCTAYVPVLLFMTGERLRRLSFRFFEDFFEIVLIEPFTDGGDCGDDGHGGDFRQRSYDHMAQIKRDIPELRVYVTIVFSTNHSDIEGAKRLCEAAGMDVATHYSAIEEEYSEDILMGGGRRVVDSVDLAYQCDDMSVRTSPKGGVLASLGKMWDDFWAPSASSSSSSVSVMNDDDVECDLPAAHYSPSPSSSSSSSASHYSGVSEKSAQRKMASHWDSVYTANSIQSECYEKMSK